MKIKTDLRNVLKLYLNHLKMLDTDLAQKKDNKDNQEKQDNKDIKDKNEDYKTLIRILETILEVETTDLFFTETLLPQLEHLENSKEAAFLLGLCYSQGIGVPVTGKEALKLFQKSYDLGNNNVLVYIGLVFLYGTQDVAKDYRKAVDYFEKACACDCALGTVNLGTCYELGYGVTTDLNRAYEYYMKAINLKSTRDRGTSLALESLGYWYLKGICFTKNLMIALDYYKQAAALNYHRALHALGHFYCSKEDERMPNYNLAIDYFNEGANYGNRDSLSALGCMYQEGEYIRRDLIKGSHYSTLASLEGDIQGLYQLANCFERGLGIEQDIRRACFLYRVAQSIITVDNIALKIQNLAKAKEKFILNKFAEHQPPINQAVNHFKTDKDYGSAALACIFGPKKDIKKAFDFCEQGIKENQPCYRIQLMSLLAASHFPYYDQNILLQFANNLKSTFEIDRDNAHAVLLQKDRMETLSFIYQVGLLPCEDYFAKLKICDEELKILHDYDSDPHNKDKKTLLLMMDRFVTKVSDDILADMDQFDGRKLGSNKVARICAEYAYEERVAETLLLK